MGLYRIYYRTFNARADSEDCWELLRNYERNVYICGSGQSTSELLAKAGIKEGEGSEVWIRGTWGLGDRYRRDRGLGAASGEPLYWDL